MLVVVVVIDLHGLTCDQQFCGAGGLSGSIGSSDRESATVGCRDGGDRQNSAAVAERDLYAR